MDIELAVVIVFALTMGAALVRMGNIIIRFTNHARPRSHPERAPEETPEQVVAAPAETREPVVAAPAETPEQVAVTPSVAQHVQPMALPGLTLRRVFVISLCAGAGFAIGLAGVGGVVAIALLLLI